MLFIGVLFRTCLMVIGFFIPNIILTAVGTLSGVGSQAFAAPPDSGPEPEASGGAEVPLLVASSRRVAWC